MTLRTRRRLLACAASAPLMPLIACASKAATCAHPDELSSAEIGMRDSLDYTDESADASAACKHCRFYNAGDDDCGSCQILAGKVAATGHCASWTQRTS